MENAKKLLEDIPNKIVNNLGIVCETKLLKTGELDNIEIDVESSYHGKYHYRSGATKQELNGTALQQFVLKKMGRSWDEYTRDTASIDDIDRKAVDYFIKKGVNAGRIAEDERESSTLQILENLHLLDESGHLKNAALLLFAKDPQKFFSGVEFKIGKFGEDEGDLIVQDVVEGNIIEMADKVIKLLKTFYLKSYVHYNGMQRVESLEIPEVGLRELLYNAIVHKDYSGAAIQMRVFDDRVELWNDGELPDGYTQETLMRKHSSKPRNRNIAATFFKAGFVEAWGRGYKKIIDSFRDAHLSMPTVVNDCGGTLITIYRVKENPYNTDVGKETKGKVGKANNHKLNDRQQIILGVLSLYPTLTAVDLSVNKRTIERNLSLLQNQGYLLREGGRKEGSWKVIGK